MKSALGYDLFTLDLQELLAEERHLEARLQGLAGTIGAQLVEKDLFAVRNLIRVKGGIA